jgi:hypothetical protein
MAIPSPFIRIFKKQDNKHTGDSNFIMTSSFTWVTMVHIRPPHSCHWHLNICPTVAPISNKLGPMSVACLTLLPNQLFGPLEKHLAHMWIVPHEESCNLLATGTWRTLLLHWHTSLRTELEKYLNVSGNWIEVSYVPTVTLVPSTVRIFLCPTSYVEM